VSADTVARILYSTDSVEVALKDATTLPTDARGFVSVGVDGTTSRFIVVDSSGRQVVAGAGTAGSPAGGVLSVQGVSGGQAIPIEDGGGSITVDTDQLPAALVGARLDVNLGAWLGSTTPTVGQKAMAASVPVVIASDQSAVSVSQSGTWTIQQGTPPWKVEGTDADGAAPTENPVLTAGQDGTNVQTFKTDTIGRQEVIGGAADGATPAGNPVLVAGQDGTNVQTLLTETDGTLRVKHDFIDDRDLLVRLTFSQSSVSATTYYVLIDLNGSGYKHTSGTQAYLTAVSGRVGKSNSGSLWTAELAVVLRIDGTDADLGVLALGYLSLEDTMRLFSETVEVLFPMFADLTVSGGDFTKITDGYKETGVTAVNTGVTFKDILGNDVTPAVGDVLLRATLVSGSGSLDFVYGVQYYVD